jgi:hypothetical protein
MRSQQLDELYRIMKSSPEAEAEAQAAISAKLSSTVAMYVRRMLEQRRAQDNPCEQCPWFH